MQPPTTPVPAPGPEPIAIIGLACRLPGGNTSPSKLWDFLSEGKVAPNTVPPSRFSFPGHYAPGGSRKPGTMRSPGGIFLSDTGEDPFDPADFDASFFELGGHEALATDPNQRQMLEIVYESLESAGIPMSCISDSSTACFTASFAVDYADIHSRDPLGRPGSTDLGIGRAILANRISWFFNLKGPSVTVDTACSGSLIALDMAARCLHSGEVSAAIVCASNIYLSPEHVIDDALVGQAHSATGYCHAFDEAADGYVKAEAVSCLVLKRLSDAIRDKDPIRAVVRGTAVNHNGRTNGIGSPDSKQQAAAIKKAYAQAGISELKDTQYLECHGTGTQAGDAIEVAGVGMAFAETREAEKPLIIGSIKSNVGHAEPAAGLSGLIKTILALEHGMIPGTPLFIKPNPRIDFARAKVRPSRAMLPWPSPEEGKPRRASVNSFGYGGANGHAILEDAQSHLDQPNHVTSIRSVAELMSDMSFPDSDSDSDSDDEDDNAEEGRYHTLVLSANDAHSLKANIAALCKHLVNPRVKVSLPDLSYTLTQRRSHLWHRAFVNVKASNKEKAITLQETDFVSAKKAAHPLRVGFVFTGQGAQWPRMGLGLLKAFPHTTRAILDELDAVLQGLSASEPPRWSLLEELTQPRDAEHLRQPEFSQPLVTALQICLLAVVDKWGVQPSSVVGHSSGEIAAAYAAGYLDRKSAIKAAFFRGRAAVEATKKETTTEDLGMLAVGVNVETITPFLTKYDGRASIACFNSPSSLTISGKKIDLEALAKEVKDAGHFARLLQVNMAYHSHYMDAVGGEYERLMSSEGFRVPSDLPTRDVSMFSSVTAAQLTVGDSETPKDISYWKRNLLSPVRFDEAVEAMLSQPSQKLPEILVEIGPSGALAGPVAQILKSTASDSTYCTAWSRGSDAIKSLSDLAGRLFINGAVIDLSAVNDNDKQKTSDDVSRPRVIVDLPSYRWNHTVKYWYESAASKDWRFRPFVEHDLIGSKILGTPWTGPSWHKRLILSNMPWLRDHKMGGDILMPAAAFTAMAAEAMWQKHTALVLEETPELYQDLVLDGGVGDLAYGLRNVRLSRALVLDDDQPADIYISLSKLPRSSDEAGWHEFRISSARDGVITEHSSGLIRIQDPVEDILHEKNELRAPLRSPQTFALWYKIQREVGMDFGPSFRKIRQLEATSGERSCRGLVDLTPPRSKWEPQSPYPLHPVVIDACLQILMAPNAANEPSLVKEIQIPGLASETILNRIPRQGLRQALVHARSGYSGRGRIDQAKGILGNVSVYNADTGELLLRVKDLNYVKLDADPKADPHTFDAIQWRPDVALLTQDQVEDLLSGNKDGVNNAAPDALLDIIAHKNPLLKVLEVSLDDDVATGVLSLWLGAGEEDKLARKVSSRHDFACANAETMVAIKKLLNEKGQTFKNYYLANWEKPALGLDTTTLPKYDLIILRSSHAAGSMRVQTASANLEPLLSNGGCVLLVRSLEDAEHESSPLFNGDTPSTSLTSSVTELTSSSTSDITPNTEIEDDDILVGAKDSHGFYPALIARDKHLLCEILHDRVVVTENRGLEKFQTVMLAHFLGEGDVETKSVMEQIGAALQTALPSTTIMVSAMSSDLASTIPAGGKDNTAILVADELFSSILTNPSATQWAGLQALFATSLPVLWLTAGASRREPERAMAHGFFRVVRRELASQDDAARVVLDVEDADSILQTTTALPSQLVRAISAVLRAMRTTDNTVEPEYRFRKDGILEIPRLVPDVAVNEFRRYERLGFGGAPRKAGLWETKGTVRLRGEKVGTLELAWHECGQEPLLEGYVEVEVAAVGVNFKDVAAIMGIVPEDEYMTGCECAGTVRAVAPGVTKVKVGDRVVVLGQGNYANRVQSVVECVQIIPSWLSFDDAATMPLVYATSLQGLYHLGNLQEGQSVLIHSAAGGVGIAAIQLAQHKKAKIFVTVGTEEKRDLLHTQFQIPYERIFSSRDAKFAQEILKITAGYGVDVVLNALTGDLLDASWRIVADGGTMVEIGKRDILDRHALDMEPFSRNCSFRALDLSQDKTIRGARLLEKLLGETFELVEGRNIGPIRPMTTYGFDEIQEAMACIRRGQHMGKLVISKGQKDDIQVPITPLMRTLTLRTDASYLIVGGIKGLCGSLALHMARHGAGHIIVCSRSGIDDESSARIVRGCRAYGCEVTAQRGDVCDMSFVRRVFASAHPRPIVGVIQGAMILRDKPFETMSLDDYQAAVAAKVAGTWNLHNASVQDASSSGQSLDFFTLLSSISGVVGNKGQANYAAGNAFLDAFAGYRRSLGLPAHSLDLGAVEDVGYIAEQEALALAAAEESNAGRRLGERFRQDKQWTPLNEQALRSAFTVSVLQQQSNPLSVSPQLVTGIAHPLVGDDGLSNDARLSYLRGGVDGSDHAAAGMEKGGGGPGEATLQAFVLLKASGVGAAGARALEKAAVAALAVQTAKVLRLENEVEIGKPLAAYGLDSLSAAELRGWIRSRLGAEVSTLDVTNARSLVELSEKVVAKLTA
ncbi:hypothetical protein QBC35DRAFT_48282 [Podospora australis]|uniref:Polyketide synthase n=1 Tax=Podospora australis TaxID=1536484 RepID=A0AAN7AET4_9PEZI|nr:hypothetical protein QBC35DRAFT_48282 [Podospora australis]